MERKVLCSKASKLATADCYNLRNNIEFIRNALEKQLIYKGKEAQPRILIEKSTAQTSLVSLPKEMRSTPVAAMERI